MSYPGTLRGPHLQVSAFGDHPSVKLTSEINAYPDRFDDPRVWLQLMLSGATISAASSSLPTVSLGTTNGALARIRTTAFGRYVPGLGSIFRFAGAFLTGGVANSIQKYGPGHEEDGLWVGYNGTDFGVFHTYNARREIETLTITTPAGGAETATITLAGTTHNVPLTAGTAEFNAAEIADWGQANGFEDAEYPYLAYAINDTVIFVRSESGDPPAGAFSFSSSGAAVGAFAQTQNGTAGTEVFAALGSDAGRIVSIDPLDGTGPSGLTRDFTKNQVYAVSLGWLGVAGATWWILDVPNSRFWPIATLDWTNVEDDTYIADPRLPLGIEIKSEGSTTDIQFRLGSQMAAVQGDTPQPLFNSVDADTGTGGAIGTTEVAILAIRNSPTIKGRVNRRRLITRMIELANTGTKDATFRVYIFPDIDGAEWTQPDTDGIVDLATTFTSFNGGKLVSAIGLDGGRSADINLPLNLDRGQVLVVTGQTNATTTDAIITIQTGEDP